MARNRWIAAAAAAVLLVTTFAVATAGPAAAYAAATGQTGCNAPNGNNAENFDHTYYYSALTTADGAATTWARLNDIDPTAMNTSLLGSVDAATDVVVYDEAYTNYCGFSWYPNPGLYALTTCVSLTTASTCEKHELRYARATPPRCRRPSSGSWRATRTGTRSASSTPTLGVGAWIRS